VTQHPAMNGVAPASSAPRTASQYSFAGRPQQHEGEPAGQRAQHGQREQWGGGRLLAEIGATD
jgi:hypothetical protein